MNSIAQDRQETIIKKQRPSETDTGGHEAWVANDALRSGGSMNSIA